MTDIYQLAKWKIYRCMKQPDCKICINKFGVFHIPGAACRGRYAVMALEK